MNTDLDIELSALQATVDAFESLDEDARGRVLRYLADRYGETGGER